MDFPVDTSDPGKIYDLLTGLVAPRPIALVTTLSETGQVDAAPYSSYNYLCSDPPILGIGIMNRPGHGYAYKETRQNIRVGAEFVVNVVTEDLAEKMNICSMDFPDGENKLAVAGLETVPSSVVKVPRLKQAHAALECVEYATLEVGKGAIVLGKVVSMYVEDRYVDLDGPYVLTRELHAVGRMDGLGAYVKTRGAFLTIPRLDYAVWKSGMQKP